MQLLSKSPQDLISPAFSFKGLGFKYLLKYPFELSEVVVFVLVTTGLSDLFSNVVVTGNRAY